MKMMACNWLAIFFIFCCPFAARGGQTVTAVKVSQAPTVDGLGNEAVWQAAAPVVTRDETAHIDMRLKAVYTDSHIFFLVEYPDPDASVTHKTWFWDKAKGAYQQGPDREDVFVFKWLLTGVGDDLSVHSDTPYTADIWFWKAHRTDPTGTADDKIQTLSDTATPRAKAVQSHSGKTMYLTRKGDSGSSAYKENLPLEYFGERLPRFSPQIPRGSRADVLAKGKWKDGRWVVEFGRKLNTGHEDDIQLSKENRYRFGVSRYEVAGRSPDPTLSQPFYGSGDVSEVLVLEFGD